MDMIVKNFESSGKDRYDENDYFFLLKKDNIKKINLNYSQFPLSRLTSKILSVPDDEDEDYFNKMEYVTKNYYVIISDKNEKDNLTVHEFNSPDVYFFLKNNFDYIKYYIKSTNFNQNNIGYALSSNSDLEDKIIQFIIAESKNHFLNIEIYDITYIKIMNQKYIEKKENTTKFYKLIMENKIKIFQNEENIIEDMKKHGITNCKSILNYFLENIKTKLK
jgi:hypothetical protein